MLFGPTPAPAFSSTGLRRFGQADERLGSRIGRPKTELREGGVVRGLWWCVMAVVLCACDSSASPAAWEVSIDTLSGGAVRVVNSPAVDVPPGWTLEETLRIGTIDGDGPASFGGIRGVAVLEDGRLAVLDGIAQEVRVFGPDGVHLATYGGKGGGPGELEAGFGLMSDSNGMLWVPDYRNARMSIFDPGRGFQWSAPFQVLSRGFIWRGAMMRGDQIWKPSITLGPPRTNVMRVYDSEMMLVDSLPLPPDLEVDEEDPPGSFFWRSSDGNSSGYYGVPFFPQSESLIDPTGAIWSTAYGDPSYRIARWVPGRDTTLVLETLRAPVTIPAAQRDSAITVVREALLTVGGANQDWSKVPETRPAIAGMFQAEGGELWVRTSLKDAEVFDVYDRDGRHVRTVQNPLNLYRWLRPTVKRDQFWAVVTDAFDVQYVVRAEIVRTTTN